MVYYGIYHTKIECVYTTKKKLFRTNTRKTRKRIQKMIYTAGNTKIGQGTHGNIYVDIDNPTLVTKSYNYDKTFCANLLDEYKIQKIIQKSYTDQFIRIPTPNLHGSYILQ